MRIALVLAMAVVAGCLSYHRGALPGAPRASYRDVAGARLRYVDRGAGSAVVLLHGFASSLETWDGVVAGLARHHRVVALDLKGFGWSDRPEGDYSPAAQGALVFALMDALGIERAAVVGHSWGSSVALRMALDRPARVSRLVLYGGWMYEEQLPTTLLWARAQGLGEVLFGLYYAERQEEKLALAFYDQRHVTPELVERVEDSIDRPGATAAALATVRGQRYAAVEKRYRTIDKPALLLWGREDRVSRLEYGERLASELPDAKLVVYPRCGHFPMIEARAASTRAVLAFLAPERNKAAPKKPKATPAPSAPAPAPIELPEEAAGGSAP